MSFSMFLFIIPGYFTIIRSLFQAFSSLFAVLNFIMFVTTEPSIKSITHAPSKVKGHLFFLLSTPFSIPALKPPGCSTHYI